MTRVRHCLLAIALSAASACGGRGDPKPSGDDGGTMVVVQPAAPKTLFPPTSNGTESLVVIGAIFDRLADIGDRLETNGDSGFRPVLAKGWSWAPDSLSIVFALRPDIKWHDGAPFRANDVRFSFVTYTSDSLGSSKKSLLGNIDSVTVRDSLTAVFWFKRRLPYQFFDATYHMYMLPSHLLDTVPQSRMAETFGRHPIGTGRFRFKDWDGETRLEIIADVGNARGRAKLDRVLWTFVADHGASAVKLFSGEGDFYEAIGADLLPQVAADPRLRTEPYPRLKYDFLAFNLRKRGDTSLVSPLFGDVRVRRALNMAVDRQALTRNVYDSLGSAALTAAPRALIPDTAALVQIPYDPAHARALLDSLGWQVDPKDGIRVRDGVRFSFEIMASSSSQVWQRFAQLLQTQLRDVGVEARPVVAEVASLRARVPTGDFDAFMNAWQMDPGRLGMAQTWRSTGELNWGKYRSADFDRLLDSAMTSLRTSAKTEQWTAVLQRLIDDQPGMWLAEARAPVAIATRIRTTPLRADGWQNGLADWSIDPAQRIARDNIGLGPRSDH